MPEALLLLPGKLVRDRVIELKERDGEHPASLILNLSNYRRQTALKVWEEAAELAQAAQAADRPAIVGELADLFEIMDAFVKVHHLVPRPEFRRRRGSGGSVVDAARDLVFAEIARNEAGMRAHLARLALAAGQIAMHWDISALELSVERARKAKEKGRFLKRLYLVLAPP